MCTQSTNASSFHRTAEEKLNIITVVLRAGDEPLLSRAQMQRVGRAHRAHDTYVKYRESLDDSDDDDGPEDDDAWLFEDLKVLTQLYSRLRDREQIIALIFEVNSGSSLFSHTGNWVCVLCLADELFVVGCHCGASERYPHDILCASRSSLQSS